MPLVNAWKCDYCHEFLTQTQVAHHVCDKAISAGQKWFLVGVYPKGTPDPEYWYARFEYVPAMNEYEAKEKWFLAREGWVTNEEKRHAKIYDIIPINNPNRQPSVHEWRRNNKA